MIQDGGDGEGLVVLEAECIDHWSELSASRSLARRLNGAGEYEQNLFRDSRSRFKKPIVIRAKGSLFTFLVYPSDDIFSLKTLSLGYISTTQVSNFILVRTSLLHNRTDLFLFATYASYWSTRLPANRGKMPSM